MTRLSAASALLIALLLGAFGLPVYGMVSGALADRPFLASPSPEAGDCVRDPAWMRAHHMDLLKSSRDDAIRGARSSDVTIESCGRCHDDESTFCTRCHARAGLQIDCFECHSYGSPP